MSVYIVFEAQTHSFVYTYMLYQFIFRKLYVVLFKNIFYPMQDNVSVKRILKIHI